ncbi:MAG: glycoside hydrolase family 28 protein [Phycisphaerae bacterium]|nr:glycoside hydrolase family 28 protein [Phycisphaerae bacterium]
MTPWATRTISLQRSAFLSLAFVLASGQAHAEPAGPGSPYDVRAFGARGDCISKDTTTVQAAIDACALGGGGTVRFAPGTYLCGSLHLKSGVTLWLDAGATIKGCPDKDDYDPYERLDFKNDADRETTYFHHALIWGEDVERVAIVGRGTIDGNRASRGGPKPIALKRCRFVEIRGVRIVNAPNYAISMLGTDYVNIEGVTILSAHCDGIDPDSCRNVRISNCHIESWDDAIVPKASFSLGKRRACENVAVTNCYLETACNAFKLGTESGGGFKRIAVSNCVMAGLKGHRPAISGIALESVDGGELDGVVVSNVTMVDVRAPIFIRLGNRCRDMARPEPGSLENVNISNVVATSASLTCSITGISGHPVEGVTLSNVRVTYKGGGPFRPSDQPVLEVADKYPCARMFDALPAYGLYCRHVAGLTLSNVQLLFEDGYWRLTAEDSKKTEWITPSGVPTPSKPGRTGPALVCDDVSDLRIDGLRCRSSEEGDPLLRLVNVTDALVRGCVAPKDTKVFLEVRGPQTRDIALVGNVLTRAGKSLLLGSLVPPGSVSLAGYVDPSDAPRR